jgi:hypothetical protein
VISGLSSINKIRLNCDGSSLCCSSCSFSLLDITDCCFSAAAAVVISIAR